MEVAQPKPQTIHLELAEEMVRPAPDVDSVAVRDFLEPTETLAKFRVEG